MASGVPHNSTICHDATKMSSDGIWNHTNTLRFSVPLLLVQLILISLTSSAIGFCLKPLGQPIIVAQVLGGVVLGPTVLGNIPGIDAILFPDSGKLILETFAIFGLSFFFFSMGVKMDANLMVKPERIAMSIATSMYIFTMIIPLAICFACVVHIPMEESLLKSLPVMVASQSFVAFPAIAVLLVELKIVNTEVGRLAVATSMFYTLLVMTTCALGFSFLGTQGSGMIMALAAPISTLAMTFVIVCVLRPILKRFLLSNTSYALESDPSELSGTSFATRDQVTCMFVLVLLSILVSEVIGQHYFLGPIILGLSIPDGSAIGGAVVSKIDTFVSMFLYPTFLAISGLKTNLFAITLRDTWIIGVIVFIGVLVKMVAIIVPAFHQNIPPHDSLMLSLVLNARGINELLIYNLVYDAKQFNDKEFALMVMSIVIVTAFITPIIKFLYDPAKHYVTVRRMTIQHAKKDTELRIAVAIHQNHPDNVPTMINLLEASHASPTSPIAVIVCILVEVVGQSAPMLLAYRPHRSSEPSSSRSNPITNAFYQYQHQHEGQASVQVLTNRSHIDTMHDDIFRVAFDKRVTLLVLPFHKQWAIDGTIGSVNRSIQAMNQQLIQQSPCSLGILIDRGPINGRSRTMLNRRSDFHVAVLFLGGADDVESLAYGSRMARHEQVTVTVIRFLLLGHDNSRERKRDTDMVEEYRQANQENQRFLYREELIKDGIGLSEIVRGMGGGFDLIMVGRNHFNSPLLLGMYEWSEYPELGVIGDLLASPDAKTTASVLVIQQQQKPMGKTNSTFCMNVNREKDVFVNDESNLGRSSSARRSTTISIDRDDFR